MSRLAKNPITIPAGVTISVEGDTISVKGSGGSLSRTFLPDVVGIEIVDGTVVLTPHALDKPEGRALWGTYASHITNMFVGVTEGYTKALEVHGVGYRAEIKGKELVMQLGFSHPVNIEIPEDLDVSVEKNTITVKGIDKDRVGWFAANVRSQKKPEPYKGKGIRYVGEIIRRKQGKKNA